MDNMSTQVNQYCGYGYMLPYRSVMDCLNSLYGEQGMDNIVDSYYDSAFDDTIVEINGFSMVIDGHSGEYVFFGKIFAKVYEYDYILENTVLTELDERDKVSLKFELGMLFDGKFNDISPSYNLITRYR